MKNLLSILGYPFILLSFILLAVVSIFVALYFIVTEVSDYLTSKAISYGSKNLNNRTNP